MTRPTHADPDDVRLKPNEAFGGKGLVYETAVAEIRKVKPLVFGVRLLQVLTGLIAVTATVVAVLVAIGSSTLVCLGFVAATGLSAISAIVSYVDITRSAHVAHAHLTRQGLGDERMIWVSNETYEAATAAGEADELDRETFSRLINAGLKGAPGPASP